MQSRRDEAAAGTVAATSLPVIGAVVCGGLLLLLLAATIVLALIPIYTPTKSVTLSSNSAKSQLARAHLNANVGSGRRRRQTDLDQYVGATCSSGAATTVENQLAPIGTQDTSISSVSVDSCGIVSVTARRRRLAFSKRATISVFQINFYVFYARTCRTVAKQKNTNKGMVQRFKNKVYGGGFIFSALLFYKNGVPFTLSLSIYGFQFELEIKSGLESGSPNYPAFSSSGGSAVTSNIG